MALYHHDREDRGGWQPRSVAWMMAAVLFVVTLAGCESEPTPTPVPPKPTVTPGVARTVSAPTVTLLTEAKPSPSLTTISLRRGGILRVASASTYATLDPQLATKQQLNGYGLLYNHLLKYSLVDEKAGKFEVSPELAESFERADAVTYIFKLRKGVKFHDGSELDAEVAKWNFDRLLTHPKSTSRSSLEAIKSIDIIDSHTIRMNLNAPNASLPVLLTRGGSRIAPLVSRKAVEKLGDGAFASAGVGTGPMELVLWRRDDQLVLKKWDGYWEKGADGQPLPYLGGYMEHFTADQAAALQEVKAGDAHLVDNIRAEDVAAVKADPKLTYWELGWGGPAYFFAGFNAGRGPFTNAKLRQAALYAIDREALAKDLGPGLARAHYYPFWQPAVLGYDEGLPQYKYDLAKAKQLVNESGVPDNMEISMSATTGQTEARIGEMVRQMWAQAGLRARLETVEDLAFYTRLAAGSFDAAFSWEPTVAVDPDLITWRVAKGSVGNIFNYSNPALDDCMSEGRSEYDVAKRGAVYKRCQRIIYEDATIGSGYRVPQNRVFRKTVKGLTVQFLSDDLRGVWLDGE